VSIWRHRDVSKLFGNKRFIELVDFQVELGTVLGPGVCCMMLLSKLKNPAWYATGLHHKTLTMGQLVIKTFIRRP